jgi:hypothetical protein
LDVIEAGIRANRAAQSPKKVFEEIVNLDKKDFSLNLAALRTVSEQPIAAVSPTDQALHQVSQKLANTSDSVPEYWETVLQFLQFASSHSGSKAPPPGGPYTTYSNNVVINVPNFFTPDKTLLLSGGSLENTELVRDRVIFTNNPVRMRNVRFVDCAFEFPQLSTPAPYLQQAAKQLLASNFTDIQSLGL